MRRSCLIWIIFLLLCSVGIAELQRSSKSFKKQRKPLKIERLANSHPIKQIIELRGGISYRKALFSAAHYHKFGLQVRKFLHKNAFISAEPITVSFQAALTAFNILCWAIPLRLKSFSQNQTVLSLANAFAGGIFLMLSFGHLLPEAVVTMERHSPGNGGAALVYTLVGYAAMLFIEKIAFTPSSTHPESKNMQNTHADRETAGQHGAETDRHLAGHVQHHSQQSAIALCCAMSIHSFFESAALGLTRDATSVYMMAASIALHQPAESVALLVSFLKSGMSTGRIVMWLVGFSVVSLGGVATGMLVKGLASGALEAVVMALTAGTFVYVGATEIANEEFDEHSSTRVERVARFGMFIAGIVVMQQIARMAGDYEAYRAWWRGWVR